MEYVFLTSENFIRNYSNINDNVHSKYIMSALRESQDINLQQILGTKLLTKLQELVADGSIMEDENIYYKKLVDKCQWFLLYQTVSRLCVIANVHISNFGLSMPNDENMQNVSIRDTWQIEKYYQDKTDHYCKYLQGWLLEYKSKLPELTSNKVSEFSSNLYSAASSGLWLGGKRGKCKTRR